MPQAKSCTKKHRTTQATKIATNVMERIQGRPERNFQKEARQRRGFWYSQWMELGKFLQRNPSQEEILRFGYKIVEQCSGHGKQFIAQASAEMLNLVVEDLNLTRKKK